MADWMRPYSASSTSQLPCALQDMTTADIYETRTIHTVPDIGLLDAWVTWAHGTKLADNMNMWGAPMLVVGRVGKVVGFLGGAVVIVDLIGTDRIKEWGGDVGK